MLNPLLSSKTSSAPTPPLLAAVSKAHKRFRSWPFIPSPPGASRSTSVKELVGASGGVWTGRTGRSSRAASTRNSHSELQRETNRPTLRPLSPTQRPTTQPHRAVEAGVLPHSLWIVDWFSLTIAGLRIGSPSLSLVRLLHLSCWFCVTY